MKSSHEVWSALATILKEANWTYLAICSLRKEKSEKRREWDRGGRVSGVLQRQALPKVKNDLRGEHCRRAQHGPCTRRGLCSAAKEVRFVLVEAARPRKKARSCVRTLLGRVDALCTHKGHLTLQATVLCFLLFFPQVKIILKILFSLWLQSRVKDGQYSYCKNSI